MAHELMKKYKEVKEKHPNIDHDMVMEFAEDMPEEFDMALDRYLYGCHIVSKDMYHDAVSHFINSDGSKGAKWTIDDIKNKASIDFDNKDYTLLDFVYAVNMTYSDIGDLVSSDVLMKIAKRYLEDKDYYGEPSERSYHDAKKRIRYFDDEDE